MRMIPTISVLIILTAGCGDKSGDIAECTAALAEIEAACGAAGLPPMVVKTCDNSKRSIETLRSAAKKTGKTDVAAEGCKKQAASITAMVAKAGGGASAAPGGASARATDGAVPTADPAPAAGASAAPSCAAIAKEIDAACGDPGGMNPSQKAVCQAGAKTAEIFQKMAASRPDVAEKGCAKTLADWAKKGGLGEMVGKAGR